MDETQEQDCDGQTVAHWIEMAEASDEIHELVMVTVDGHLDGQLHGESEVLATGVRFHNGAFWYEAREAVIVLGNTVITLDAYAAYVQDVVALAAQLLPEGVYQGLLPMTFEDWLGNQIGNQE